MKNILDKRLVLGAALALTACLSLAVGTAVASETIRWIVADEPPITYLKSEKHVGYGMDMLHMLQKKMPQYDHEVVMAGNYKRVVRDVKEGPLTCAIGLFRTPEREKSMHFSQVPFFYFYNIQIAMKKDLFSELGNPASISLKKMLKQEEYTLGLSAGRTYSDSLRVILDESEGNPNIFIRPHSGVAEGLFNMLLINRIDYMLLYPDEAMYLSQKADARGQVVTVPIEEAFDLSYSWCACTQSPQGKKAASAITDALIKIRPLESYRAPYERWISPNLLKLYRDKFKDEFLHITKE